MLYLNGYSLYSQTTKFPDGTSQIWNIPLEWLDHGKEAHQIKWVYKGDQELMRLAQLEILLRTLSMKPLELFVPYLPYARQDKEISNNTCFGLDTIAFFLNEIQFNQIIILDPHSDEALKSIHNSVAIYPYGILDTLMLTLKPDVICYPDDGAYNKYKHIYGDRFGIPVIHGRKDRDQATGKILSLELDSDIELKGKSILIIDDICDGGATFIKLAELLYKKGAFAVDLFVTHGLFSRGFDELLKAKIRKINSASQMLGLYDRSDY